MTREGPSTNRQKSSGTTTARPPTTSSASSTPAQTIMVIIFYEDEGTGVPYGLKLPAAGPLTLGMLKIHLPKKGNYKYYCNRVKDDPLSLGEEVKEDEEVLPVLDGKIVVHLET